ncbi:MAG: hypothetical protein RJB66_1726 [Pseudomonadota bacterium]
MIVRTFFSQVVFLMQAEFDEIDEHRYSVVVSEGVSLLSNKPYKF